MKPILPGAALGVFGGGQLGRFFTLAARQMGYRVHVFSQQAASPAGQVADEETCASFDDIEAVTAFASAVAAVTFEFENVPVGAVRAAERHVPVRPSSEVLCVTQDRLREKAFLDGIGVRVAPYRAVHSAADLRHAIEALGCPAVLKTAAFGYDGKGQATIGTSADAPAAWEAIGRRPAVLERYVDFEREISVVAARSANGAIVDYGAFENHHRHHVLDFTVAPARIGSRVARQAVETAHAVLEALGVIGVACVEFFVCRDGQLLVNEIAPRPHNSGHLTIDACVTSQFEQQVRAVCGLRLGSPEQFRPAAMANLLGDLWHDAGPDWRGACEYRGVKLHLYGKDHPRPGRKMGHLTALAGDEEAALHLALAARASARA
jgi:5-(carboxyamino)imidazole ribonucleotide synthase